MASSTSLSGYTALVTGASRGIGAEVARRLAAEGAAVAVNFVQRAADAEALAGRIAESGGRALPVRADVGDPEQVGAMFRRVESEFGPVDLLVNNAGLLSIADLDQYDAGRVAGMRRVNIDGVIHTTRAAAPSMKARGFGRIVNVTSIAALGTTLPGNTFYAATKAEIVLLTRRFALELGPWGITVNAVAPGFILTDMVQEGRTAPERDALVGRVTALTMVGRAGQPEDIAHAVAFLVSPQAGFITAQVLTIDGGRTDYIAHP